jgi:pimeloyl-ACP methyl ester carboxylesterase
MSSFPLPAQRNSVAQKVIIPNAAHVPNMEAPDAFNQAVLHFLQDKS